MSFQYTTGDPTHLTGGQNASMVDIQGPFTDLKTFLNSRIAAIPTIVSALPGSPVDAQEIYYLADASNGIVWHLRYRSASASAYKWEFVGGASLRAEVATSEAGVSAAGWVDLTTVGPQITVPLGGDYEVRAGALPSWGASASVFHQLAVKRGAVAVAANDIMVSYTDTSSATFGGQRTESGERLYSALTSSTVLKVQYNNAGATNSATPTWAQRWVAVRPVRVG